MACLLIREFQLWNKKMKTKLLIRGLVRFVAGVLLVIGF